MNYIRGAFSAASQYYTSLPPINPSTLTGAIDVIVLERQSEEHPDETELACSPFHVRFGKFQAFRPGDRKVNVLVNGETIPFNMKIGEAGEAFFVIETEDDVPPELLTSPLLEATKPGEKNADEPKTGRFGSKDVEDNDDAGGQDVEAAKDAAAANGDPTFLDLNSSDLPASRAQSPISSRSASPDPDHRTRSSSFPETTDDDRDGDASTPPTSTPSSRKGSHTETRPDRSQTVTGHSTTFSPSSILDAATGSSSQSSQASPPTGNSGSGSTTKTIQAALSHGPSALAAKIAKARDAVKKSEFAAHPVDVLTEGVKRMSFVEEENERPPVEHGKDAVADMQGYHDTRNNENAAQVDEDAVMEADGEEDDEALATPIDERRPKALPRRDTARSRTLPFSPASGPSTPSGPPLSARRQFLARMDSKSEFNTPSVEPDTYPFPSASPPSQSNGFSSGSPDHSQPSTSLESNSHLRPDPRSFRAGSEPPDLHISLPPSSSPPNSASGAQAPPQQEYMWEWGAFPQKSPSVERARFIPFSSSMSTPKDQMTRGEFERGFGVEASGSGSTIKASGSGKGESASGPPTRSQSLLTSTAPSRVSTATTMATPPRSPPTRAATDPKSTSTQSDTTSAEERNGAGTTTPESSYGMGGRLISDPEDDSLFWVEIEGKQFMFQLSLCGPLSASIADPDVDVQSPGIAAEDKGGLVDEVADAKKFEESKVTFAHFTEDDSLLDSEDLVIKWGITYVSKHDSSPLFSALHHWRKSVDKVGRIEMPAASVSQPVLTHSRGSSWTRWWPSRKTDSASRGATPTPTPPLRSPRTQPLGRTQRQDGASTPQSVASLPIPSTSSSSSMRPSVPSSHTTPVVESLDMSKPSTPTPTSPPLTASRPSSPPPPPGRHYIKTLRLTSDQLKQLNLKKGANTITFSLSASGAVACTARIFLWESSDLLVVSDIDGTITKSDALGHVFTMIGRDWTHVGVAKLYTDIARNGYNIMYLTSRAIGQADSTRDYLKGINQNNYQLPEGPVIMSPDRLMTSLHREVIMKKPEVFKMACLRDIQRLYGKNATGHFYAGFGNRITDALSYRSVNIPSSRIFTIDSSGEVKMELLELAGYKSSYIHMTDLVDQMFPPVHRNVTAEFTDFNYWRPPMGDFELPDLTPEPASPALSARSDTSRLSRLRNFSLISRSSTTSLADKPRGSSSRASSPSKTDRAISPLASPLLEPLMDDPDEEYALDNAAASSNSSQSNPFRRDRRLSMPGSIDGRMLDDEGFGESESDLELAPPSQHSREHSGSEDAEEGSGDEDELEDPDAMFNVDDVDDDIDMLAGQMKHIPYL